MPEIPDADNFEHSTDPERFMRRSMELPEQTSLGAFAFYISLTICLLVSLYLRIIGL